MVDAEELRGDICRLLTTAKPLDGYVTTREWKALQALCRDNSIVVLKVDKGNATVILDSGEYRNKVHAILQNGAFKMILKDPMGNKSELS